LQSDVQMSLSGLFRPLLSVLQKPNHLRAFGLIALMMFSSFLVIPFISVYTVANVHIPEKQLALIYFAGGFATLFTSRFIGKIADKVGAKKMFIGLSLIAVISIFLTTHLQPGPIWMVLLVSTLFFIVVPARMIPSGVIVNAAADPHTRGTFLSLSGAIQSLVQGGASLVAAYIISRNSAGEILHYDIVGYLSIAFVLFSIVWVGFVRPFSVVLLSSASSRPNV
jgi:predicted MFS family arabinose efflux permease